jgi:hypothetical protein
MWNFILAFGESIQAGYVDCIYQNAAIGDRNLVGHMSVLVLLLLLVTVSTAFLLVDSKTKQNKGSSLPSCEK